MKSIKGHAYNKAGNWVFRWVTLIEDGDAVHMAEAPLSPEYIHGINNADRVEAYVLDDLNGNKIAKLTSKSPYELPYSSEFPELYVKNVEDGSTHEVFKYIKNTEGEIHIWCATWYGHHIIGRDCIFTKKIKEYENANG